MGVWLLELHPVGVWLLELHLVGVWPLMLHPVGFLISVCVLAGDAGQGLLSDHEYSLIRLIDLQKHVTSGLGWQTTSGLGLRLLSSL